MNVSTKTEYGLRCLLLLARQQGQTALSISQIAGQERLADILLGLQAHGLVRWRAGYTAAQLAQHFSDAARGVNQTLPPQPATSLHDRYRNMFAALLGGVAE